MHVHTYALSRSCGRASFPFIRNIYSVTQDLIHDARPVGSEKSSGLCNTQQLFIFRGLILVIVRGKTFCATIPGVSVYWGLESIDGGSGAS